MKSLNNLEDRIKKKKNILMILDYDGVVTSTEPRLSTPLVKRVLENLARKSYIKIRIITSRKISDFKEKFEIDTGNIEIYGVWDAKTKDHNSNTYMKNKFTNTINYFFSELKEKCSKLKKIIIDNKNFSIILDYKLADDSNAQESIGIFKDLIKKYDMENNFKIVEKDNIIELAPVHLKKENIIDEILKEIPDYDPLYIGDDKLLISKIKELNGFALGILPLCPTGQKLVDFSLAQNKFEEFLIDVNNLYL